MAQMANAANPLPNDKRDTGQSASKLKPVATNSAASINSARSRASGVMAANCDDIGRVLSACGFRISDS
jgi:hypothetical protein